jgi:hypothetical protein
MSLVLAIGHSQESGTFAMNIIPQQAARAAYMSALHLYGRLARTQRVYHADVARFWALPSIQRY